MALGVGRDRFTPGPAPGSRAATAPADQPKSLKAALTPSVRPFPKDPSVTGVRSR